MLDSFDKDWERTVERFWFPWEGGGFVGDAVIRWQPGKGLTFHGCGSRRGPPLPESMIYGKPRLRRNVGLRLELDRVVRAFVPDAVDEEVLILEPDLRHVSLRARRIVVFRESGQPSTEHVRGTATYRLSSQILWPDSITTERSLAGRVIGKRFNRSALHVLDPADVEILGEQLDTNHARFSWTLPGESWTRDAGWRFANAIETALLMMTGRGVDIVERRITASTGDRSEIRIAPESRSPGILAPLLATGIMDKERFSHLVPRLARRSTESFVSHQIIKQLKDARHQTTRQATELLVATILEAALRNIEGRRFKPRAKGFNVRQSLYAFDQQHWSQPKSRELCDRAFEAFENLRHRNVHPDWQLEEDAPFDRAEEEEAVNDMLALTCLYGHMILALNGINDSEPEVPELFQNAGGLITVTRSDRPTKPLG